MGKIIEIGFLIVLGLLFLLNLLMLYYTKRLQEEETENKISGFELARLITSKLAEKEPHIIKKKGKFLDYYDANRNVIKLSPEVFDGTDYYAQAMAYNVALLIDPKMKRNLTLLNLTSFLVMASYIVIVLGAFLNNSLILHFGMVLFIVAFLLIAVIYNFKQHKDIDLLKYLNDNGIDNKIDKDDYFANLSMINVANLPYRFLIFFR